MEKKMLEDFKEKLAEYVDMTTDEMTEESRFIEDLGMNSFQFMALLGDLEEEYDVAVDESEVRNLRTIGDACGYIENLLKEEG